MATLSPEEFNAKLNAAPQAPVEPEEEKPITLNDTLMQSAASNELDWQTQLKGLGIEGGGSVVGTAATLKGIKTYKTLNMLRNVRRVGQGAALAGAAGPQAVEPVSTAVGIGTVLITEGLWSVGSNFLKQEFFKSKGIQEETSGGELLTSMVLLSPIIHQGRHIPKLGQIFDTSMIKSRTWKVGAHTVQGATIGAVESSIRQTWDLVAAEDKDLTDFSFTDLATGVVGGAGLGGAVSTVGETFSGLKLLNTYRKVVQRSKIEMTGSLNERLARLEKTIEKSRRMNNGRRLMLAQQAYADTKKKRDIFYALHDELEDNLDSLEAAATPKPKPEAPEASATTATPKDTPETTPAPNKFTEDIPSEDWLEGKIEDAVERGTNRYGVPRSGSQTGGFDTPVKLPLDKTKGLKGANGEEVVGLNQENVDKLAKELTEKGSFDTPVVVGVMHDGTPYILEGNHRLAASQQAGIPVDVEIRYFDGGQRKAVDGWKPKDLDAPEATPAPEAVATPEATPAPKPIIQFNKDGIPYKIEGTYIRFGDLPEGNSTNGWTGKTEEGHSVYKAYFDPKTKKYIILDNPYERGVATQDVLVAGKRKIYEVSGQRIGTGSDGEHLIDAGTSKQLKEIKRSDVVLKDEPFQDIDLQPLDKEAGFNMDDATMDFPEGFKLADYTYKKNNAGSFDIFKDGKIVDDELRLFGKSEIGTEDVAKDIIKRNIDEDLLDFKIAQKDAPEATPAPKTPEVAPEAQSPMQGVYDSYEKLINNMDEGRGGNLTAELNDTFNRAADDFNQRAEAFIENPNDDTIASLEEVLDEFIILDKYDARLKQSQGQGLGGQAKNAKDKKLAGELPLPRKTRQEGLKGVREKLRLMRDDGDFSRFDEFLEKVLETPETPVVTPKGGEAPSPKPKDPEASTGKTKAPKKTPQQRQVERLQKQLDDLRAIRSGEQDPKAPKPKKAKSAEVKDLEDRIKFYKGESKEVAEIAKTEERIALFLKLLRGGDVKAMQQELGLPPAMRPEFTKKKTPESYLNDLKEIESGLKKDIRKRQTQEILADINKATNPSAGTSSPVDSLLDGLISARTASLLNQPTTSTTGLPSGAIAYFWRMGRNSINDALKLSGITGLADPRLKGTRFKQKAILATSEMVATASQIFDVSPKALISGGRNMKETFLNLGNSAYFYKDGNKFVEQDEQIGNAFLNNQAAAKAKREELRLRAIQAEGMIERALLNTGASKPFEYVTKLYLLGRTVLGTLDEPFLMAMNDRGNRAEAIRQSILTNAADPEKFIQDYMANVSKFEGGATRFNYFDEQFKDVANQTRRDLFRKADLDRKDIRRNPSEIVADGINRLFAGSVVGKLLGGLFSPFVSTPVIGLGQNVGNQMSSFGVQPTVRLTQGISDRLHRLIFPHRQSSAVFGKYNKALQSARLEAKKLQEEIDGKTAKGEDVKSEEVALGIKNEEIEQLTRYKEDAARDDLARSMIAFSVGLFSYYATKEGLMLGSGAGLEDEQRRESNFQKRKNRIFLDDTKSVGFSYMLFEQFRGTMSIWSDIASYEMLADNGALTDDQKGVEGFINFITNSIEATATDAPFTTGLRQFSDLAIGDTEEKMQTAVSIGSSSLGVPSGVRSANRFGDDVYYDYSRGLTMENLFGRIGDAALGLPTSNVRTDQLGRPVSPNQKSPWNYAFRYAPERLKPENALERDAMIEDLLLNDATSFGLISKKPTSLHINKVTVPMKKFVNQDGDDLTSLYERTLNEDDAMIDEIWEEMQTSSWETAYDNYKVDSKDGKPFNKGIERINKIIKKHRNKTKKKLSDETGPLQYYYYKGQNVFEYIQAQKMLPQATGDSKGILH